MRPIDADALFDVLYKAWGTEIDAGPANDFMEMINNAPTITPPSNQPLTLEELREMGVEPVWVEEIKHGTGFYGLLSSMTADRVTFTISGQLSRYAEFRMYGKTWLAYRRKPDKGTI